ncbi:hypothetical protein HanXRQr2_Chr13g0591511 [Helianthus annuus]|uniref:Uncharacterized protein n=1 Tax=Helianthus annuus TaxID=4232 RepID=A0A251S126_HELAN|nr:hypothetical protein HanXRQr2_Chr13g0591511 [Helianthus annuus]KAJ0849525.1 hypothetical protein HanPSC8_Chr13g0569711 [Helianthus annuus]
MDSLMGYWFSNKTKEVTKDINDVPKNIKGGAKKLVTSATEKRQKPLADVLQEYELPPGIFPREAIKYVLDAEAKKLTVTIPKICEVSYRDSSVLRFSTSVTCHIEKGKLTEIEGLKTKVVIWVRVTSIVSEDAKLHFTAGLNKTRERKLYQVVRDGVPVDKF